MQEKKDSGTTRLVLALVLSQFFSNVRSELLISFSTISEPGTGYSFRDGRAFVEHGSLRSLAYLISTIPTHPPPVFFLGWVGSDSQT